MELMVDDMGGNILFKNRALIDNLNHNDPDIRRETALIIKKKNCILRRNFLIQKRFLIEFYW